MKIVIDISEEIYDFVQNTSFVEDESTLFKQTNSERRKTLALFDIIDAIRSGTPLPEQQPCEDCISREDAIDVIYDYEYKKDMRKALVELPSVTPKTEWIPASERLPKAGEYVGDVAKYYLVQNEYGDMLVARHTHSEYWEQIYQLQPIGDEIVAWMPLPQPYKAESGEEE